MERIPVDSSNLKSVGYDPVEHLLEIAFHSGGIYRYFEVPESVYRDLMRADSKGRYFCWFIRNAGFRYHRRIC